MADITPPKKRWYDRQQTISRSVTLLESFPAEFQIILGESIIDIAENQCRVNEVMAELRSLGPEKVLSIFKSKSKQRNLDAHQEVHQAMNYLYILSDGDRIYIANHIIALVSYFFEYFKICKTEGVQPSANIARQVSKAYLQGDLHDPSIFLTIIRKQIQLSTHYSFQLTHLGNVEDPVPLLADFNRDVMYDEKVDEGRQGLKIRRDKQE
jgi:hypothetical protein